MKCFQDDGFYGIKLHALVLGMAVDDPIFFPIYEKMEQMDKILLLHAGTGPDYEGSAGGNSDVAGVKRVKVILKHYPNLKLVIPHLGTEEMDGFFDLMGEYKNLWMDTTMMLAGYFSSQPSLERIEELSDRILYGSDAPNIPYPLDVEIKNIKKWFSKDVQEKLFFKNAQKLLGLTI
jgi:predicted TIM-barrel fold metal-dependent hydrolase